MLSENLPSFGLLVGYSGSIDLLHALHSVQTRRDKKSEAISRLQHTLEVV